jgi:hypothetical protein
MTQTRIKKPPLTQHLIDHGAPDYRPLPWWAEYSGLWLTIAVALAFIAGMWALYAMSGMSEVYRAITSPRG